MKQSIRNIAESLLLRRNHSVQELKLKLKKRQFSYAEIGKIIEELMEERLLCDRRFAEHYCRSRAEKGYGPYRIREELIAKGINQDDIHHALNHEEIDWYSLARKVREKKFKTEIPQDLISKAKQQRFLQYRGFTFEQIDQSFV